MEFNDFDTHFTFDLANGDKITGLVAHFDYDDNDLTFEITIVTTFGQIELDDHDLAFGVFYNYLAWLGFSRNDTTIRVKPSQFIWSDNKGITKNEIENFKSLLTPLFTVDDFTIRFMPFAECLNITFSISDHGDNQLRLWLNP